MHSLSAKKLMAFEAIIFFSIFDFHFCFREFFQLTSSLGSTYKKLPLQNFGFIFSQFFSFSKFTFVYCWKFVVLVTYMKYYLHDFECFSRVHFLLLLALFFFFFVRKDTNILLRFPLANISFCLDF